MSKTKKSSYFVEDVKKTKDGGLHLLLSSGEGIDIPLEALEDPFFSPEVGDEIKLHHIGGEVTKIEHRGEVIATF